MFSSDTARTQRTYITDAELVTRLRRPKYTAASPKANRDCDFPIIIDSKFGSGVSAEKS
jgi:hypothetical protein